eukprot:SAG31_NODE_871_length_11335_cov_4.910822_10_plen_205_part_00
MVLVLIPCLRYFWLCDRKLPQLSVERGFGLSLRDWVKHLQFWTPHDRPQYRSGEWILVFVLLWCAMFHGFQPVAILDAFSHLVVSAFHHQQLNPEFIGCAGEDGYTHDAECVVYTGPDVEFQGEEICFLYNENTLTITDVTDKENPVMLSRVTYDNVYYTHQGWLTEDQSHLFLDDELDESRGPNPNTRTCGSITLSVQPVLCP